MNGSGHTIIRFGKTPAGGRSNVLTVFLLAAVAAVLMAPGPCRAEDSAAFQYSGIPDYYRNPTPENYRKMQQYMQQLDARGETDAKSVNTMIETGADLIRASENDFGGALKTVLRNVDNTPGGGSALKTLGTGAEFLDFLNRAVKVSDEYNKGKGGNSYNAAVLAGRELTKMLSGNYLGGLAVTAIVSSGGSLLPAFVAGYAASKGAETFLQTIFDAYDAFEARTHSLQKTERQQKMAAEMRKAKDAFDIPDDAQVTTYEDERGNTMQETTWTDPDSGESYTHATWFNEYGHEVGNDFDRTEFMNARKDTMGAEYRRTAQSTVGRTIEGDTGEDGDGSGADADTDADDTDADADDENGDEDDSESEDVKEEEEEATPDPGDINILDYVEPQEVTATARETVELSHGSESSTITTMFVLKFTNVGSLVPFSGNAVLTAKTVFSNGRSETVTWTGTFSGGPNGVFRLSCEGEEITLRLRNGTATEPIDGTSFVVQGSGAFKNWPKELQ